MKLTSSFSALSGVILVALFLGQAQAESAGALGLTHVDESGAAPFTPLTTLNLEPSADALAQGVKDATTPPPLPKQKRLLGVSGANPAMPIVDSVAGKATNGIVGQGLNVRELGNSLLPSLPVLGGLDNEGDHSNAAPVAPVAQKRLVPGLELPNSDDTLPPNRQQLGRSPHPLNRRDSPLDLNLLGQGVPELPTGLPAGLPVGKRLLGGGLPELPVDLPAGLPVGKRLLGGGLPELPVDLPAGLPVGKRLLGGGLPDLPVDLPAGLPAGKRLLGGGLPDLPVDLPAGLPAGKRLLGGGLPDLPVDLPAGLPVGKRDSPLDLNLLGQGVPELPTGLPAGLPAGKRLLGGGLPDLPVDLPAGLPAGKRLLGGGLPELPVDLPAGLPVGKRLLGAGLPELPVDLPAGLPVGKRLLGGGLPELPVDLPAGLPVGKRDSPLDLNLLGQGVPSLPKIPNEVPAAAPVKRANDIGLNALGQALPVPEIPQLDSNSFKYARDGPLDLGLAAGNAQDADRAQNMLGGLVPSLKRDGPVDLGLSAGNEQDKDRATNLLGGLVPGLKRDTISPDNLDLGSVKNIGGGATKEAVPIALSPIKQTASPAVQGLKAANSVCSAFGCQQMVQGTVANAQKSLPLPKLPGARRGDDLLASPAAPVLDLSDKARDQVLGLKDKVDQAGGSFAKNLYAHPTAKRDLTLPGYEVLPGAGPGAKDKAKETIDFIGLPIPGLSKRMQKIKRRL